MNILFVVVFLFFGFLSDPLRAGAGNVVTKGPVTTRFVVEKNLHPQSKTIQIGWWMKRKEGWHTYWDSPGDVGLPPTLEWDLPEGITFRSMLYAPPQLVKMFKVFAHGHRGETLFVCNFNVERDLHEGEELIFKAKSSWLVCYTTCLPTHANMQISIPVNSKTEIDSKWGQHFQKFWREQPAKANASWLSHCQAFIRSEKNGEKEYAVIRFPCPGNTRLPTFRFFTHGRFVRSNIFQVPKRIFRRNDKDLLEISMELSYWRDSNQKELSGLLYRSDGWPEETSNFYEITLPLR